MVQVWFTASATRPEWFSPLFQRLVLASALHCTLRVNKIGASASCVFEPAGVAAGVTVMVPEGVWNLKVALATALFV